MNTDDNGRPQIVYCNGWKVSQHILRHEVLLTDFMLLYLDAQNVKRGPFVDRRIRMDAQYTYDGRRFAVEFDTGEETHRQVAQKWNRNYRGVVQGVQFDFLLVVTMSEKRLATLRKWAAPIESLAVFSTLDTVQSDPHGYVWCERSGKPARIPRAKGKEDSE